MMGEFDVAVHPPKPTLATWREWGQDLELDGDQLQKLMQLRLVYLHNLGLVVKRRRELCAAMKVKPTAPVLPACARLSLSDPMCGQNCGMRPGADRPVLPWTPVAFTPGRLAQAWQGLL